MCGIAAIFGESATNKDDLLKSLERVKHRGTDLYEYRVFENAVIGANRLPIVDRVRGQQPLANEDETIFAVQNGEIFNYKNLREELIKKGHSFKTASDTEVLTHLYEEYGEKLIDHIDSEMFAFVIYDKKNNQFYAARDRFGVKPFYYAEDKNGRYHFASELKQLASNQGISEIKKFPPAHYMVNGKLTRYYTPKTTNDITDLYKAKQELTRLIVEAVRKRVDTDLPVAVLLSGGVDSSLIMEIANRLHPDVTAFILGSPGAPDYEAAIKLCREYKYKHRVIAPDVDYGKEVDSVIEHLETYEAQIVRQAFALDVLSKAVVRAGFRIALAGDASDEIFAGYNEFISLRDEKINEGCLKMVLDLANGHNQRLDRMTMKHTLEVRAPFFDTAIVDYALKIHGGLKIKRDNHRVTTKAILRQVAQDFLPDYVAYRYKVPFSNGAGMNVGFNFRSQDGDVAQAVLNKERQTLPDAVVGKYGFVTEEEQYYFQKYQEFKFDKLAESWVRIITKDNLRDIDQSPTPRLLVAEFDKLPVYYPLYHAWRRKIFENHGIEVDFISTGGDDLTYNSLLNNSAQIGLADPVFSYTDNPSKVKGRIIGELIGKVPLRAVAIQPTVNAKTLKDLKDYRIGTFQKFTTTHTIAKYLLPDADIQALDYKHLLTALNNKQVDIVITIPDFAEEIIMRGGHLVYDLEQEFNLFLFSGFTISDNIEDRFRDSIDPFLASIKEAIKDINNNPDGSLEEFKKEFPELTSHKQLFNYYQTLWSKTLKLRPSGVNKSKHVWHSVYPWLLKANLPRFIEPGPEDEIVRLLSSKQYSRDVPYREDELRHKVRAAIEKQEPIKLVGFWGASNKNEVNMADLEAIQQLETLKHDVNQRHDPGLEITLILSDHHARLNGFDENEYQKYLHDIEAVLNKADVRTVSLSTMWRRWKIRDDVLKSRQERLESENKNWWNDVLIKNFLEESAEKIARQKDHRKAAQRYYVMRRIEAEKMRREYKDAIFFTYSSDQYQPIFPDMATLYLWVKKGTSHSPWFSNQQLNAQ
jgi:asparagine synthase (glutamine-hydrolysing)